jgi:GNAT superfamily N-acetyltransferase
MEWALQDSPIFEEELSAVAEVDGKVVGCWLSSVQELKITRGLRVRASSGLIVVHPEYRRRGIGTGLWEWRTKRFAKAHSSVVGYGVSARETHRHFWSNLTSSPALLERAAVYGKLLTKVPIEEAARRLESGPVEPPDRSRDPFLVHMSLKGFPDFTADIRPGHVSLSDSDTHHVEIRGDLNNLSWTSLLWALLTRRLRVSGIRYAWRLFSLRGTITRFVESMREVI